MMSKHWRTLRQGCGILGKVSPVDLGGQVREDEFGGQVTCTRCGWGAQLCCFAEGCPPPPDALWQTPSRGGSACWFQATSSCAHPQWPPSQCCPSTGQPGEMPGSLCKLALATSGGRRPSFCGRPGILPWQQFLDLCLVTEDPPPTFQVLSRAAPTQAPPACSQPATGTSYWGCRIDSQWGPFEHTHTHTHTHAHRMTPQGQWREAIHVGGPGGTSVMKVVAVGVGSAQNDTKLGHPT